MGFRTHLEQVKGASGSPLSKFSTRAILATLREFTLWLSQQNGFRSRIRAADADYFNLSRREDAEARAAPTRPAPSIKQAKRTLAMTPATTPRITRDKAVFALLCLTGVHVGALISLWIKHVNLDEKSVTQNPREVATKFGKSIDTFFAKGFPEADATFAIGERIRDKVAAACKRVIWMGGYVLLGYDMQDPKLLVNDDEDASVRRIFERIVELGSATVLVRELRRDGFRNKQGTLIDKGYLYRLLNNRVYRGEAVHKGKAYPGEHDAIIDNDLWDRVHAIL